MTARVSVAGYVRVSTGEQAASGYGLSAQRTAIAEECERRGWSLAGMFSDEGESGKSLDRPALRNALELVASGTCRGLVVSKLDRLSRSVVDFATLLNWFDDGNRTLVALDLGIDTTTPGGRLVATVFASVAEWERETIAARTRDGLRAARQSGKPISRQAVADHPHLRDRISRQREAGLTLQQIADGLNAEGVPTLRGGTEWRPSSVQATTRSIKRRKQRVAIELPQIKL